MPTTQTPPCAKPKTLSTARHAHFPATPAGPGAVLDTEGDGVIEIVSHQQADDLATHLLDPDRDKPVIVISQRVRDGWAIDAASIYDQVTPLARVARIRDGWLTRALARALPTDTEVYGSAGRVYPPGNGWTSAPESSMLRIARGPHTVTAVAEDLVSAALLAGYRPAQPRVDCNCDHSRKLSAQVRELEQDNRRLLALAERSRTPAVNRPPQPRQGTTDPQARFRAEVARQWISRIAHADPTGAPLPEDYPLTDGFLATLEGLTDTEYRKTASVAMEILTGLVTTIPGRRVHPLRTGTGGNNPHQLTGDGQIIWRANIHTNTPAARRIHWTRDTHGRIELLRTTSHDQPIAV